MQARRLCWIGRVACAGAVCMLPGLEASAHAQAPATRWYRGNTHTHTLNSDGDVSPAEVVRWYGERGYDFIVITDHELITDVAPLNTSANFLVMSGQEVTQRVVDPTHPDGIRQAHLNALGTRDVITPLGERGLADGTTVAATYERNIAAIRAAGGVAQINHPNYRWSVPLEALLALPDSTLFEVWNGHPNVYNNGGTAADGTVTPSTDALWDAVLTRGRTLWGVADDDSHHFKPEDAENKDRARPGRGWVMVRADTLTAAAILGALRRGEFYSTTGVTLRDYRVSEAAIEIDIDPYSDRRYTTEFIGRGGRVLTTVHGTAARYPITGEEGYVRARVTDSSGRQAWTQPVRVPR